MFLYTQTHKNKNLRLDIKSKNLLSFSGGMHNEEKLGFSHDFYRRLFVGSWKEISIFVARQKLFFSE